MANPENNQSQFIIYQTEAGDTRLDVRFQDETVWLTQKIMAELFQTSASNIGMHLTNIYTDGELDEKATTKDFLAVQHEGARQVTRKLKHYNLDAIISVGYRVQSFFKKGIVNKLLVYLWAKIQTRIVVLNATMSVFS